MSENAEKNPGEARQIAIVGLNRETANLLPSLLDSEGIQVVKVLNPELEDLNRLTQYPHLAMVIDTTHNPVIAARLKRLPLKKAEVITGLGARILFCSIRQGQRAEKDGILQNLEEIRDAVCLSKNKAEIFRVILTTAIKSSGADTGSIMLLDPSKRQLTIECAYGMDENVIVSSIQRVGKGVSGTAIRRCESILIQGPVDMSGLSADYQSAEIVSSICCPLMFGDEAVGVINIASKHAGRIFDSKDVTFLEELAGIAAEVAKASKDYESNQSPAHSLGLLTSAREILAMKYRFEERLNLLLMKIANAFGARACIYYEYNPPDKSFMAKASSSVSMSQLREHKMPLDDFFTQRLLKAPSTLCVNATGKAPRSKKWFLLQPIRPGNVLLGTLFVYLHSEKNNLKEELGLIKKIGELLTREMSKHRDMEAIRIQSLRYTAITQFSFDIANARTLQDLSRMIMANLRLILEAETCVLRLRRTPDGILEVRDTLSHRNPGRMKEILTVDEYVCDDLAPGRGALKLDSIKESPYAPDGSPCESVLAMAIEFDGKVLGSLSLYDKRTQDLAAGRTFSDQDKEVLVNFCLQAGKGLNRFLPFPAMAPLRPALLPTLVK